MFAKNLSHRQPGLFDNLLQLLPAGKREKAMASREMAFYEHVYCRIEEEMFAPLYAGGRGRPNCPVNAMVSALVLRELLGLTFEELFRLIDFDVLVRLALGLWNLEETPFCPATLFNFQQRLLRHESETGANLLEGAFAALTAEQLKRFGVKTDIQRCDSFRAMSNIANYGRVRLLVEVLLRLSRALPPEELERLGEVFAPYAAHGSDGYVYRLEDADLPRELESLGALYARLHAELGSECRKTEEFGIFERAMREQFEFGDGGKVRVRGRKEIGSGTLQSPDDPDATFNAKGGKPQKGHKVNVVETANPENGLNLITDVSTTPNNMHDGTMLAERMDVLKERTPDLEEMHTDGGYGGQALDPKMAEHEVLHVETGTKMGHARVNMQYAASGDGYEVSCPQGQTVGAERTSTRWKAVFAEDVCSACPFRGECPATPHPGKRTFYFEESWAKTFLRSLNIQSIPEERRTLRANVEATMKEFTRCFNHKGKLRVRGLARTGMQMLLAAMGINFGRIFRSRCGKPVTPAAAGAAEIHADVYERSLPAAFAAIAAFLTLPRHRIRLPRPARIAA